VRWKEAYSGTITGIPSGIFYASRLTVCRDTSFIMGTYSWAARVACMGVQNLPADAVVTVLRSPFNNDSGGALTMGVVYSPRCLLQAFHCVC